MQRRKMMVILKCEVRAANLLTLNGVEKLAGVQCAAHRACAGTTKLSIVNTMR